MGHKVKLLLVILLAATAGFIGYKAGAEDGPYKEGDTGPAGGLIFLDKGKVSDGWRYLEAAPEDQSKGIVWNNKRFMKTGADGFDYRSGKANTEIIIKAQGKGDYAAIICKKYRGGGKDDWYLPSKSEMFRLSAFAMDGKIRLEGSQYWTSTEYAGNQAWFQPIRKERTVSPVNDMKTKKKYVRAIRAF